MEQLLIHLVGDYLIQSDWMALNKKAYTLKGWVACLVHCSTYALPFIFITNWLGVILIMFSHLALDKTILVPWLLSKRNMVKSLKNFGFESERPAFISIWLCIITDNTFHLVGNYFIIKYVGLL